MFKKLKNLTEYTSLIWYFLFIIFLFILAISIVDSVKLRLKIKNIEKEINKRVEKEIKWYEENLNVYKEEIEKYKRLYEKAEEEAKYYRRIYRRLQIAKTQIKMPKTSEELRRRFEKLGYPPVN